MLKGKDITLPTKIHIVKAMVFPVVMYGFESWTIKKAELWRIDAFKLCCWRRLWILIGRSDAEAPIFWQPDAKSQLIGKDPYAGKDWRQKERRVTEDEMAGWHHLWQWAWTWANSGRWWGTERPGVLQSMGSQRPRHDLVTEQQQHQSGLRAAPTEFWGLQNEMIHVKDSAELSASRNCSTNVSCLLLFMIIYFIYYVYFN